MDESHSSNEVDILELGGVEHEGLDVADGGHLRDEIQGELDVEEEVDVNKIV